MKVLSFCVWAKYIFTGVTVAHIMALTATEHIITLVTATLNNFSTFAQVFSVPKTVDSVISGCKYKAGYINNHKITTYILDIIYLKVNRLNLSNI